MTASMRKLVVGVSVDYSGVSRDAEKMMNWLESFPKLRSNKKGIVRGMHEQEKPALLIYIY